LTVTLTDPPVFSAEELRNLIPLQDGDILSAEKIRDGLAALGQLYGEHGYIDFVAAPLTDIDDEHQIVSLTIDLIEDKQFRIGKIEVSGLDARLQNALAWNIKPGDVFDNRMFEKFFETNQSVLPPGASMSKNSRLNRSMGNGTVDVVFNFSPCPSQ
jgi:outer membrane protein assembly factor BamA